MQFFSLLTPFLMRLQGSLLRVDYDPPVKRSLLEQIQGMFSGNVPGMSSIFAFKYLIYWVELFVIFSIVLLAVYVAYSLNLFKRSP